MNDRQDTNTNLWVFPPRPDTETWFSTTKFDDQQYAGVVSSLENGDFAIWRQPYVSPNQKIHVPIGISPQLAAELSTVDDSEHYGIDLKLVRFPHLRDRNRFPVGADFGRLASGETATTYQNISVAVALGVDEHILYADAGGVLTSHHHFDWETVGITAFDRERPDNASTPEIEPVGRLDTLVANYKTVDGRPPYIALPNG